MSEYRDTLPPIELVVAVATKVSYRYRLTADELSKQRVDSSEAPTTIRLADATRVQLASLGGTTFCEVHAGAHRVAISSGLEPMARGSDAERAYYQLIEAVNERVAMASPAAKFLAGSWMVVGGVGVCAAIGAAAVAFLSQTSFRDSPRFTIALIAVALGVFVALPVAVVRARPRPYDPRKIPRVYDPLPER